MKAKIRFSLWLRKIADKIHPRHISRDSVMQDSLKISPGAKVLFTATEQFRFSYALMIQNGIFKGKDIEKYAKKGERRLKNRFGKNRK